MALTYHRKKDNEEDKNTADPWKLTGYGLGFKKEEQPQTPLSESVTGMFKDEQIACWLDGNAPKGLCEDIIREMYRNDRFAQYISEAAHTDTTGERAAGDTCPAPLPLAALAAAEGGGQSLCGLHCEMYLMQEFGREADPDTWTARARAEGWLTPQGMHMGHVGDGLEAEGIKTEKHFDATLFDLQMWLNDRKGVIAIVDGGELTGDAQAEHDEDRFVGEIPDHAVVILGADIQNRTVTIHDPQSGNQTDTYPFGQFDDAWADSCHYAIVATRPQQD